MLLFINETGTLRQRLEAARRERELEARVKAAACTYCGRFCVHSALRPLSDRTWHREGVRR